MQKSPVLVLLISLLQSCAPALAPEPAATPAPEELVRNPWRGFAPGSWVVVGMSRIGHENAGAMSLYRDEVVGTGPAGDPIIRSTWKSSTSEQFQPSSSTFFNIPRQDITFGMSERSRRRETLKIGGRTLNCRVVEYAFEEGSPNRERTLTIWRADGVALLPWDMVGMNGRQGVPADVVRATLNERRGQSTAAVILDVDDFASTIEVGGRKVECVVGKVSSIATYENGTVVIRAWRIWLSPDVPGGVVRRDRQCSASPTARPHEYTVRDEVTAFNTVR